MQMQLRIAAVSLYVSCTQPDVSVNLKMCVWICNALKRCRLPPWLL